MMQLRDYQTKLVNDARDQILAGKRRILLQLPCGGGKTACAGYILRETIKNGFNALMMAHRAELVSQISRTMTQFGVRHGIVQAGVKMDVRQPMQVASVLTLRNRLDTVPIPKVVVIDESQHLPSKSWREVADYYYERGAIILGLSASPVRLSGESLADCFDVMVKGPSVRDLIEIGALCKYRYYAPTSQIDMSSVSVERGDYVRSELELATNKSHITGDAIGHYQRLLPGKRAIAFCVSVAHAQAVAEQFTAQGIPALAVDGQTPKDERAEAMERFKRGEILVLTNCDLYGEGVDVPAVEGVILLRPTMSLSLHIQQTGRALRPDNDNPSKVAIILDHASNVYKHGLPDDDHDWTLEPKEKRKRKSEAALITVRQCPMCYRALPGGTQTCECGYQFPIESRVLEEKAGELKELTAVQKFDRKLEVWQAKTLQDFQQIEKERGYKPGWAYCQMKLREGRKKKKVKEWSDE
jgi:superfamily II DNA or RNA helicase